MLLLLLFAFLAGAVTILAPCIWPILPIVLSSSVAGSGGGKRPLGITLGIMLSFLVFTLFLSALVRTLHLDANALRLFAVLVIGTLGLAMIVPSFSRILESLISRLSGALGQTKKSQSSGFWGGFITGLSLGIVWSPCAGPILAAIATLAAESQVSFGVFLVTLFYVIGTGIPLFAFSYGGQRIIKNSRFISGYTGIIQQIFGVIMVLTAVAIFFGLDQRVELKLLDVFPFFSQAQNGFEGNNLVTDQLNSLKGESAGSANSEKIDNSSLFNTDTPAPDFAGITHWLNTDKPLSIRDLRGKVVLVDFWTYSCINCLRTLPHVTTWYNTYKDKGFIVIGVHTPEFEFEHDTGNVASALKQYNIDYPVAQDNNYSTWNAYNNQYWPAEYLIDSKGIIRREDFGEGEYTQMEMAIQQLLKDAGQKVPTAVTNLPDQTPQGDISPETYFGSNRMEFLYPEGSIGNGTSQFSGTSDIPPNSFSYSGTWTINSEYAVSGKDSAINYNFIASHVYLVAAPPPSETGKVKVLLDGKITGEVNIDSDRLYNIVNPTGSLSSHKLQLQFETPGIQVYTFTFG